MDSLNQNVKTTQSFRNISSYLPSVRRDATEGLNLYSSIAYHFNLLKFTGNFTHHKV